jgi:SAM-dependent methyltransferase
MASTAREFSSGKHRRGEWNTRMVKGAHPLVRACCRYLSFKRALVDDLAKTTAPGSLVLDLGCGIGAYGLWFSGRSRAPVVAVDWSFGAVRAAKRKTAVLAVCADGAALPFRSEVFDAAFSIDTLGHVSDVPAVLDELLRTVKPAGRLALHSECIDPQTRWPDRSLLKKNGVDLAAAIDGHHAALSSKQLRDGYTRRFIVHRMYSPAGYLGWLTGYPEKYLPAMIQAGWWPLVAPVWVFSIVKKLPVVGWLLRLGNRLTNHLELALGLAGGGSCFALMEKPARAGVDPFQH